MFKCEAGERRGRISIIQPHLGLIPPEILTGAEIETDADPAEPRRWPRHYCFLKDKLVTQKILFIRALKAPGLVHSQTTLEDMDVFTNTLHCSGPPHRGGLRIQGGVLGKNITVLKTDNPFYGI